LTVLSRSDLASKSKIPPKIKCSCLQIVKQVTNVVDAFCFHVYVQCVKP
jgi:hypothetical protein